MFRVESCIKLKQDTVISPVCKHVKEMENLELNRPRWKTFNIDEPILEGRSGWPELISCSKKH